MCWIVICIANLQYEQRLIKKHVRIVVLEKLGFLAVVGGWLVVVVWHAFGMLVVVQKQTNGKQERMCIQFARLSFDVYVHRRGELKS